MNTLMFAFFSALGNTANSLGSSGGLKTQKFDSALITLASLLPSFLLCLVVSLFNFEYFSGTVVISMILKNILYGISLYLRFSGLARLGAFQGAMIASSQPVIISFISLSFLNEQLKWNQWLSVVIIASSLVIPMRLRENSKVEIIKFAIVPALLQSLIVVIDRWILISGLTPMQFFIIDKLILFPVVFCTLWAAKVFRYTLVTFEKNESRKIFWLFFLGLTWGISSYTYGVSLAGQKTALVSVIRNLAFPLAAIMSVVFFKESLNLSRILSLGLSIAACALVFF